jgi:hypothetical protein
MCLKREFNFYLTQLNAHASNSSQYSSVVINDYVPEQANYALVVCLTKKVLATVHVNVSGDVVPLSLESPFIVIVSAMTAPVMFT